MFITAHLKNTWPTTSPPMQVRLTNTTQLSILAFRLVHILKNTLTVNKITRYTICGWSARSHRA